jgi:hypothetical protein
MLDLVWQCGGSRTGVMFERPCQTHGAMKVNKSLHLNIKAHGFIEAYREEVHLVLGREYVAVTDKGQELALVVLHCDIAIEIL